MAAIVWVGGTFAVSLAVQPAARKLLAPTVRVVLYREVGRRFVWIQWISWSILILTGVLKLTSWRGERVVLEGPYGFVLASKLTLVGVMVVLSLLHGLAWGPLLSRTPPESPEFRVIAARMAFWGKINLACLAGIVFCAAALRSFPW